VSAELSHLIVPLKDLDFSGKQLFVRPEDFKIVNEHEDAIKGNS
jgi:hypothetical protein